MLTGKQIAAQLGVRRTTIGRWRRAGRLTARICNEMGEWLNAPQQNVHPTARVRANAPHRAARTTLLQEVQYGLRVIATVEDPLAVRQILAARRPAETLGPGPPARPGAPPIAT